jgi:hypothetical protein
VNLAESILCLTRIFLSSLTGLAVCRQFTIRPLIEQYPAVGQPFPGPIVKKWRVL